MARTKRWHNGGQGQRIPLKPCQGDRFAFRCVVCFLVQPQMDATRAHDFSYGGFRRLRIPRLACETQMGEMIYGIKRGSLFTGAHTFEAAEPDRPG